MYRTYNLTDEERKTKHILRSWDGDCTSFTVCDTEEEYEQERARLAKIDEEAKREHEAYLQWIISQNGKEKRV